jgi:gliding motility-associated-like protein
MLWGLVAKAQDSQWSVCVGDTGISYFVDGWETSTFEWTVEGGTITRNFGDSIIVDWPSEKGDYVITVLETSVDGCAGELKSGTVQVMGPEVNLGGDSYVCDGLVFEIVPEGDFETYLWHDGSTGPGYSTGQEGWISVEVTDSYGCAASDSIYLSVVDLPFVDLGNDTALCGPQSLILDGGPDGEFYTWSTGELDRTITVYSNGEPEIWVIVENGYGCIESDTILVSSCDVSFYFRDIPTGITPNGDGRNDSWEIDKLIDFTQSVVEIFNQWGILVWKSEPGYSIPWDGRDMNGKLVPVDSYHFVIDFNDDASDPYVGIITVIR